MADTTKKYLGDAVYADVDDVGALVLTTEDGIRATNRIVLEPEVLAALFQYVTRRPGPTRQAVAPIDYETRDDRFFRHDPDMKRQLNGLARYIDNDLPDGWGFGLFLFQFGDGRGRSMMWISNGQRPDMVKALQEWISRQGGANGN